MQQENLLKDLKEELKEVKEQLKVITILLEKKSKHKNDDENNESRAEKEKYSITLNHREACRITREWFETRTLKKNERKRHRALNSIEKYGSYSYNIHQDSSEGLLDRAVTMSHVMRDIPIKLQKNSTAMKDEDDNKVLTQ
eukprot:scaffold14756_cov63-Attheya_sp.AAC.1